MKTQEGYVTCLGHTAGTCWTQNWMQLVCFWNPCSQRKEDAVGMHVALRLAGCCVREHVKPPLESPRNKWGGCSGNAGQTPIISRCGLPKQSHLHTRETWQVSIPAESLNQKLFN